LSLKWLEDVRRKLAPELVKEELRHHRKSHIVYLDPWHNVPDWIAVLELGIPGLLRRSEKCAGSGKKSRG
jgi:hypothetical protein